MAVDVARKRDELLVLRERILRAANDLAADDEGHGEISGVLERELRARVGELPGSGKVTVRARPCIPWPCSTC